MFFIVPAFNGDIGEFFWSNPLFAFAGAASLVVIMNCLSQVMNPGYSSSEQDDSSSSSDKSGSGSSDSSDGSISEESEEEQQVVYSTMSSGITIRA